MRGTQGIALHDRNAENWCTEEKHFIKYILNGIFMEYIIKTFSRKRPINIGFRGNTLKIHLPDVKTHFR